MDGGEGVSSAQLTVVIAKVGRVPRAGVHERFTQADATLSHARYHDARDGLASLARVRQARCLGQTYGEQPNIWWQLPHDAGRAPDAVSPPRSLKSPRRRILLRVRSRTHAAVEEACARRGWHLRCPPRPVTTGHLVLRCHFWCRLGAVFDSGCARRCGKEAATREMSQPSHPMDPSCT
eukprot:7248193-Prymnesium_polylepis.2